MEIYNKFDLCILKNHKTGLSVQRSAEAPDKTELFHFNNITGIEQDGDVQGYLLELENGVHHSK